MKTLVAGASALAFIAAQALAMPAYAEQASFRTTPAQTFSATDLQRYGLDENAAQRAQDLQARGYEIKVLTPAEAAQYQAGITDNQWLLLGVLAGVIVIAVAVS